VYSGDAMSETEITGEKQRPAHLFKPGQSGNPAGRPKGSRSRLSESFIADLHTVWEKHGLAALEKCATDEPGQFIRVLATLMPKDINLSVALDPADFASKFRSAQAMLGNDEPPGLRRPSRTIAPRTIEHESNDAG
jgi:hypothetical protein